MLVENSVDPDQLASLTFQKRLQNLEKKYAHNILNRLYMVIVLSWAMSI